MTTAFFIAGCILTLAGMAGADIHSRSKAKMLLFLLPGLATLLIAGALAALGGLK